MRRPTSRLAGEMEADGFQEEDEMAEMEVDSQVRIFQPLASDRVIRSEVLSVYPLWCPCARSNRFAGTPISCNSPS